MHSSSRRPFLSGFLRSAEGWTKSWGPFQVVLVSFALGEAVKLRRAEHMGREVTRDNWDRIALASSRVVEIGGFAGSSAHGVILDWSATLCQRIFDVAGFGHIVPGGF